MRSKIVKVIISVIASVMLLNSCTNPLETKKYIFESIDECNNIKDLEYTNIQLTEYESPDDDKCAKGLVFNDFYAVDYKSDELKFTLFAYQFDSVETSRKYFENHTGKNDALETNFSHSRGTGPWRIVTYDCERAYYVVVDDKYYKELEVAFSKIFSKCL